MRDLKASVFSTVAEQTAKATCAHRWTEYAEPSRIFGYLVVEAECAVCGTYRGAASMTGARRRCGAESEGREDAVRSKSSDWSARSSTRRAARWR